MATRNHRITSDRASEDKNEISKPKYRHGYNMQRSRARISAAKKTNSVGKPNSVGNNSSVGSTSSVGKPGSAGKSGSVGKPSSVGKPGQSTQQPSGARFNAARTIGNAATADASRGKGSQRMMLDNRTIAHYQEVLQHNGSALQERSKIKVKLPRLYKVILLNDDHTPMNFVVELLVKLFNMKYNQANKVMLEIHNAGYAVCGIFTLEIAESKASQVYEMARIKKYPLKCRLDQE